MQLTWFQVAVLRAASVGRNNMRSSVDIAATFPGWKNPASRGALVGHVDRAAYKMQQFGLICRLPPKDRWDTSTIVACAAGIDYLEKCGVCQEAGVEQARAVLADGPATQPPKPLGVLGVTCCHATGVLVTRKLVPNERRDRSVVLLRSTVSVVTT